MKQAREQRQARLKIRQKISLRRKISLIMSRAMLIVKILLLIIVSLMGFTSYFDEYIKLAKAKLYAQTIEYGFVLRHIKYQGNENISEKELTKILNLQMGSAILNVNLYKLKARVEQIVWVEKVIIERRLPDTIFVKIIEKKPVAIWQSKQISYLIDQQGRIITRYYDKRFNNLLRVIGEGANFCADNLLTMINLYPALADNIKVATRYGRRRWDLYFEHGLLVKMPERNFVQTYEYLQDLYKKQKLLQNNYRLMDLRGNKKYYIK